MQRLLRAAKALGYPHPAIEVRPDGAPLLIPHGEGAPEREPDALGEWETECARREARARAIWRELAEEFGREPTDEEVAMAVRAEELSGMTRARRRSQSKRHGRDHRTP